MRPVKRFIQAAYHSRAPGDNWTHVVEGSPIGSLGGVRSGAIRNFLPGRASHFAGPLPVVPSHPRNWPHAAGRLPGYTAVEPADSSAHHREGDAAVVRRSALWALLQRSL